MKKIFLFRFIIFLLFSLCCRFQPYAQISAGGNPPSFDHNIDRHSIPVISVSAPDVNRLLDEDAFYEKQGMAMRFAESVPVDIRLTETGRWESLPDGGRICRLTIESESAQALIIYYSRFRIPDGGKLFLYNRKQSQVIGAFTSKNNPKGQSFATEMIYGGQVTLEYYEPENLRERPDIVISEVGYVYRTADRFYGSRGFGNADTCEVNVNCPEGDLLQDQKNGVARIIVKSGFSSLWCTGSLINNTRLDFTPYFLTADHCGANASPENYNQWIFYFRYEGPDCEDPVNDSLFNTYTMVGASKLAASGGAGLASDFKLLLLNESVPGSYNPFFNGWNLAETPSTAGVTIHHPEGDIKKISTYTDTLISTNWGSIPNTHWKVYWVQTETNWGVTEGGSSGSPLFDEQGRILGQLTGGEASCRFLTKPDYYGKISYSWAANASGDSTMLRPWLDPDDTGTAELNGFGVNSDTSSVVSNFSADATELLLDQIVQFEQLSIGEITVFNWFFEGGEPAVSNQRIPPPVNYNRSGLFDVTLIVSGRNTSDTLVKTNYINVMELLYPNPTKGDFILNFGRSTHNDIEISVFDLTGQAISHSAWDEGNQIRVSLHIERKGFFIVRINSADFSRTTKVLILP